MGKITKPSDEGLQELIRTEGVRYQVYDDATGKTVSSYSEVRGYPTIGVGHLIKDKERSQFSQFLGGRKKMSKNQVFRLLKHDIPKYAKPVTKRIEAPITQSMFDALVSLAYNAGTNARSLKAAIAAINKKDYDQAAKEILNGPTTSKGRTLTGLVKRRKAEAKLFLAQGKPGALLQRIFFWTGVTAGTIAASVFGWKYVSKKFLSDKVVPEGSKSQGEQIKLYKTNERHSSGNDVYRPGGEQPKSGMYGLTGRYYVFDGYNMYACDKPYKDDYGTFDGEPSYPIYNYVIV